MATDFSNNPAGGGLEAGGYFYITTPESKYGVLPSELLIGGHQEFITLEDRDAIPIKADGLQDMITPDGLGSGRRRIGMIVVVVDPNGDSSVEPKHYILLPKGYFGNEGTNGLTEWNALSTAEKLELLDPTVNTSYTDDSFNTVTVQGTGDPDDCWFELVHPIELPSGGSEGQVLTKIDNLDYNVQWSDPQGGSGDGAQGAQGDDGNDGIQGAQGATGNQGVQGAQGDDGNDGIQGAQGATGNQGVQGAQGDDGNDGIQGAQGDDGNDGIQGAQGATGNQGVQGAQGDDGNDGIQGAQGADGASANCIPVSGGAQSDQTAPGTISTTVAQFTSQTEVWISNTIQGVNMTPYLAACEGTGLMILKVSEQGNPNQFVVFTIDTTSGGLIQNTGNGFAYTYTSFSGTLTAITQFTDYCIDITCYGADGIQGAQGAPGSGGGGGGTGVYVMKLEYSAFGSLQSVLAVQDPSGTDILNQNGFTFTITNATSGNIDFTYTDPNGHSLSIINVYTHAQLNSGNYFTRASTGLSTSDNGVINLNGTGQFTQLNQSYIGLEGTIAYVTWQFSDNEILI